MVRALLLSGAKGEEAMLTYLMLGVVVLLLFLCVAGDFASYSGRKYL